MKIIRVHKDSMPLFYSIPGIVYKDNPCYRSNAEETARLLLEEKSTFHTHATLIPFLVEDKGDIKARFVLIHDLNMPDYVQIAFFEAGPNIKDLSLEICSTAKEYFPGCKRVLAGFNGHLNYGAGILLNKFDIPPVYDLPYNPPYYKDYFKDFCLRKIVSFSFETEPFIRYSEHYTNLDFHKIKVRTINKNKLFSEIQIYTHLNNACFQHHPYWTDRTVTEDYEIFASLHSLLQDEHLLFAECDGKPVGFLLWFPDYNQLAETKTLGQGNNGIDTLRLMEIAVLPGFRISRVSQAMILALTKIVKKYKHYTYTEAGFIFKENTSSMNLTMKYIKRATGTEGTPYREYGVFEKEI